jgi:hypothetical protein
MTTSNIGHMALGEAHRKEPLFGLRGDEEKVIYLFVKSRKNSDTEPSPARNSLYRGLYAFRGGTDQAVIPAITGTASTTGFASSFSMLAIGSLKGHDW